MAAIFYSFFLFLQLCNVTIAENDAPTRITALIAARKRVYVNAVYIADSKDFIDSRMMALQIVTWKNIKIMMGNIACVRYNPLNFERSSRVIILSQ